MTFRATLFLLPLAAMAQAPPPEVDQALRARVTEFFQDHVDGNFRKAFDLVAEDTKDYYFSTAKTQYKSFKIDEIKYSDNFDKAEVHLTCQRMWRMAPQFPEMLITFSLDTTWKVENGKWVWYRDPATEWVTPMGPPSKEPPPKPDANTAAKAPKVTPESVAAAAQQILQPKGSLDKNEVVLTADTEFSGQVVFHNGYPGSVKLALDAGEARKIPGLSVELNKETVNAGESAILKVHYEPSGAEHPSDVGLRILLEPFHQAYAVSVKFAASAKDAAQPQ